MTTQLSKKAIDLLRVELAKLGLEIRPTRAPKLNDWIAVRERAVRSASFRSQSAFWKSAQLGALKTRRKVSPEYEAFISGPLPGPQMYPPPRRGAPPF